MDGTLTLGTLVAFLQYSQRFFRPISDMSEKFNLLQAAMASSERIFALLDAPVDDRVAGDRPARRPAGAPGRIVFDHVWFAYNDDNFVLRDVSFDVEPGERIGIVGATGAGKSTIINLLLRFYDVQRGRIPIDGVDMRELDLAELRGLFGLVLQDVLSVLRHDRRATSGSGTRASTMTTVRRAVDGGARRSLHRRAAAAARRRRSPSAARRCRSGRSSCCRSRARWRSIRAC